MASYSMTTPEVDRSAQCFLGQVRCLNCNATRTASDAPETGCTSADGVHRWHADTDNRGDGQQKGYVYLCDSERKKGFVRPVRRSYKHLKCGTVTTMGQRLAETYARDPGFYTGTFCCGCGSHFPVGEAGEFVWADDGTKVGT